jgi:RNA-directed DNA polymerase
MKGREKSDGRVVPKGRRKPPPTEPRARGGKASTASQRASQLELFTEAAENSQEVHGGADGSLPLPATCGAPSSGDTQRTGLPAMTMEEVAEHGNLKRAFARVASNDGAPGPDKQSVEKVRTHLDHVLRTLHRQLLDGSYRPGMIRRVWIPKGGGGQRGLGIPNVVDRIVQQAVHQVLSPQFEPTFHEGSHGFRPGRSCHTAIDRATQFMEEGHEWVVDIDLEKFFDRVHHQRLLARLETRVSDRRLLRLVLLLLKAKVVMPDGVVVGTDEGTPQGGPLSPLLSNIVLDELDWELERRGHRFVRYADDCNIYVRSERAGQRVMASITEFIEKKLRLSVNKEKSAVANPKDRHFLGFSLYRKAEDGTVEVLLSKRSKERIDAKLVALTPRTWGQSLEAYLKSLNRYLRGWFGFFWITTDMSILEMLDAHIRRRLRAIVLRHWKTKRTMVQRLTQLGVRAHNARRWLSRRSAWWDLTRNKAVRMGLRNRYFAERGLVSLRGLAEQRRPVLALQQLNLPWDN